MQKFKYKNNNYLRKGPEDFLIIGHNQPTPQTVGHLSKANIEMQPILEKAFQESIKPKE